MSRPSRFLIRMALFLVLVAAGVGALYGPLQAAFLANPIINGIILGALLIGIFQAFRTVARLSGEVNWIDSFRRSEAGGATVTVQAKPRLLASAATMLGERSERTGQLKLNAQGMRTILDGVATRLDESRETGRYMVGLLVFLGLLGTFWGLLDTVRSVGGVIGELNLGGNDTMSAFADLQDGLQTPLEGMGTAFSSSLFGLAGSLVLGFLVLQVGQAQNRFFTDLEDWLSSLTRLTGSGPVGDDASVPAYVQALLEQTADSLDALQRQVARTEEGRAQTQTNMMALVEKLDTLSDTMRAEQSLLIKLAEGQMELKPILEALAGKGGAAADEATRSHIRNVEMYLGRMLEDMSQGRAETIQELRNEIRLLARTVAATQEKR